MVVATIDQFHKASYVHTRNNPSFFGNDAALTQYMAYIIHTTYIPRGRGAATNQAAEQICVGTDRACSVRLVCELVYRTKLEKLPTKFKLPNNYKSSKQLKRVVHIWMKQDLGIVLNLHRFGTWA